MPHALNPNVVCARTAFGNTSTAGGVQREQTPQQKPAFHSPGRGALTAGQELRSALRPQADNIALEKPAIADEHRSHGSSHSPCSRRLKNPGPGLDCAARVAGHRVRRICFVGASIVSSTSSTCPSITLVFASGGKGVLWAAPQPFPAGRTRGQPLTPPCPLSYGTPRCGAS